MQKPVYLPYTEHKRFFFISQLILADRITNYIIYKTVRSLLIAAALALIPSIGEWENIKVTPPLRREVWMKSTRYLQYSILWLLQNLRMWDQQTIFFSFSLYSWQLIIVSNISFTVHIAYKDITSCTDTTLNFPGAASFIASSISLGLISFFQVSVHDKPWIREKGPIKSDSVWKKNPLVYTSISRLVIFQYSAFHHREFSLFRFQLSHIPLFSLFLNLYSHLSIPI